MGGARILSLLQCNAMQSKGSVCKYKRVDFFDGKKPVMTCKEWKAIKSRRLQRRQKNPHWLEPEEKGQEKL